MRSKGPSVLTVVLVLVLVVCVAWFLVSFFSSDAQEILYEDGSIEVVFCPTQDCEGAFIRALNDASDVACAFYDLRLENLTETLISKDAAVIVFDEEAEHVSEKLTFTPVRSSGLMHNKFCVLDGALVITGSMNPTVNGAYKNDNNLLFISSPTLARRYTEEYGEIFFDSRNADGPTRLNLSGSLIEVRFCPKDSCEEAVLQQIARAKHSIDFMTFSFTSDPIGEAILSASDRDVVVSGVFEKRQTSKYSEYDRLHDWGLNVTYDGNPQTMHHKVFIIDEEIVITGSYNPTKSANERNDENLLIIHDREIAAEYLAEFDRIWTRASLAAQ